MLNAFCRVAPSVRFNFLAILDAGVFRFAIAFRSRTSLEVHARRFFVRLAIEPPLQMQAACIPYGSERKVEDRMENILDTIKPSAASLLGSP
jgi:hypothetical protein